MAYPITISGEIVANEFADKYTPYNRPGCYSDPDYYDEDDKDCRACSHFTACGVMVGRKTRAHTATTTTTTAANATATSAVTNRPGVDRLRKQEPSPTVPPNENDNYWSVLSHNASLEAVQAVVDELAFSIRQAPRKSYHGMFVKRAKT